MIYIKKKRKVNYVSSLYKYLADASLANFASSVPRNISLQTSSSANAFYTSQGPAFDARPVTVIGTFDSGTSVSTHTNYSKFIS